jgi:chitinase
VCCNRHMGSSSRFRMRRATLGVLLLMAHAMVVAQVTCNSPPIVMLTNPPSGSLFSFPSIIRLKASASDSDGSIIDVHFYEATNLLGTITQPPYQLFLTNVLGEQYPGSAYVLTATATDDKGATSTSAPVNILVIHDVTRPIVSITAPFDGASFLSPGPIAITASVSTRDGSENPVRFYSGTNLIGIVPAPPYTLMAGNLPVGQHDLTAKYTDDVGTPATSAPVRILVTPLALSSPARLFDGGFRLTITGLSTGRSFQIQASTNSLLWTSLATNVASSNSVDFIDAAATNSALRLYRAFQILE